MAKLRDENARRCELAFAKRPRQELYDCRKDPYQRHNLASDPAYAATLENLSARLTSTLRRLATRPRRRVSLPGMPGNTTDERTGPYFRSSRATRSRLRPSSEKRPMKPIGRGRCSSQTPHPRDRSYCGNLGRIRHWRGRRGVPSGTGFLRRLASVREDQVRWAEAVGADRPACVRGPRRRGEWDAFRPRLSFRTCFLIFCPRFVGFGLRGVELTAPA